MTKVFSELCEEARGVLARHQAEVGAILSGTDDPALKSVLRNHMKMTGVHIEELRECTIENLPD